MYKFFPGCLRITIKIGTVNIGTKLFVNVNCAEEQSKWFVRSGLSITDFNIDRLALLYISLHATLGDREGHLITQTFAKRLFYNWHFSFSFNLGKIAERKKNIIWWMYRVSICDYVILFCTKSKILYYIKNKNKTFSWDYIFLSTVTCTNNVSRST
jgi:hypothetical protein